MNTLLLLIRGLVRAMGYLLGAFLVGSVILDILGLMPYSTETPPLIQRLRSDLPLVLQGAVLLVPMRLVAHGVPNALLKVAYAAVSLLFAVGAVRGIAAYLDGGRHWLIIPSSLALAAIVFGNAVVLWSMSKAPGAPAQRAAGELQT
jgi:hypothetical protein